MSTLRHTRPFVLVRCFAITVGALLAVAGALHAQPLDTLVVQAWANDPKLKAKDLEFRAAMQQVAQVSTLPDPRLSLGVFITPVETRLGPQRARVSLMQMFPWFGMLDAQGRAAEARAQAVYDGYLAERDAVAFKVRVAFHPLHELDRSLQVEHRELDLLSRLEDLARERYANGQVTQVDVLRARMATNAQRTAVEVLEAQRPSLVARLNALRDRAADTPVTVLDSITVIDVSAWPSPDSLERAPDLIALQDQARAANARADATRAAGGPSFGLGLDYLWIDPRTDADPSGNGRDALMPMLTLDLPIFRKRYTSARMEAELDEQRFDQMHEAALRDRQAAYAEAWWQAQKGALMVDLMDAQIDLARSAADLLVEAYAQGQERFEEVLRMEDLLLRYRLTRLSALKEHRIAVAKLQYLTSIDNNN
ncbi:MAG: TolC family protein [Flavobacteriales bacterium]|nr:TolC family protein [Flavobacteriales bacterium]MCB9168490.1 TolC family protein [Flavobacteriales bacterium]